VGHRFRGEGLYKVDGKGRVSIPALFRRVLEAADPDWEPGKTPNLVIVYGPRDWSRLDCYTMEAIADVDARIDRLPRGSKNRKLLERIYNGMSLPTNVDETGRLVLPARLRQKIGLESEAYFIATGDTFQIWHPETYEREVAAETEALLDDLPEGMDPLELLDAAEA
jgi:MraZ protein